MWFRCQSRFLIFNTPYRLALFSILVPVFLVLSLYIAVVRMPVQEALEARGVTTTAVVQHIAYERSIRPTPGGKTEIVTFRFRTRSGEVEQHTLRRSDNYSNPLRVGRNFQVTYLPEAPEKHFSSLDPDYATWFSVYASGFASVVLGLLALYEYWRKPAGWPGPKLRPMIAFR